MAHTKNRTEILDSTIKKAEMEEHYLGWDDDYYMGQYNDYEYDDYYCCEFCTPRYCDDYEYDMSKSNKDGRMIDLDSLTVERKRQSRINKILDEDGTLRVGDFVNGKL